MSALTSRLVLEDEELSMDLMMEKFHEGVSGAGQANLISDILKSFRLVGRT